MDNKKLAIGVFDSGMGGISVLAELIKMMPNEKYIYYGDSKNAPYGVKTPSQVIEFSKNICEFFIDKGVKAIVIACNTATSAAVKQLREIYDIPIIGMEPALKPAVEMNLDGKIVVMATEMTLKEKKFNELMKKYGQKSDIIKLPCPKLVELVESGIVDGVEVEKAVRECFYGIDINEISSIVLGCTHYIYLRESIRNVVGDRVYIIDGNEGTARHLKNILKSKDLLNDEEKREVYFDIYNSKNDRSIIELSKKLLKFSLEKLNYLNIQN
ncbi:glutamate racemase [Caminicella sporogenes]|uniref:glutamate racemase n=1 Tax=Caminicella sporogenes TaxID=166485 RepID=UPI00253F8715|nr:glutamate racemase [Caminicella sporogenes]WIF95906.1 glutamate racemase [Caminicella sporogenes]